jgi:hypothetical protein
MAHPMKTKLARWRDALYQIAYWGHGVFLLFGLYSFIALDLLDLPLPRFRSFSQVAFSAPMVIFAVIYILLWKVFNKTERSQDKKDFAYFALILSAVTMFSFWYSDPRRAADRASVQLRDRAFDLTASLKYDPAAPEEWYDSFYWTDQSRESTRAAIVEKLSPVQAWNINRHYNKIEYLRARVEYLESLAWPDENRDWLSPEVKAKMEESDKETLIVDVAIALVALASVALVVLCEIASRAK